MSHVSGDVARVVPRLYPRRANAFADGRQKLMTHGACDILPPIPSEALAFALAAAAAIRWHMSGPERVCPRRTFYSGARWCLSALALSRGRRIGNAADAGVLLRSAHTYLTHVFSTAPSPLARMRPGLEPDTWRLCRCEFDVCRRRSSMASAHARAGIVAHSQLGGFTRSLMMPSLRYRASDLERCVGVGW